MNTNKAFIISGLSASPLTKDETIILNTDIPLQRGEKELSIEETKLLIEFLTAQVRKFEGVADSCSTCGHSPCLCRVPLGGF